MFSVYLAIERGRFVWLSCTFGKFYAVKKSSSLLIATLVFVASSCGVFGGSSQSAPKLVEPVATALVPASDGYSFPNFESTSSEEQFDGSDLFAMFGAEACVDAVTNPCEPIAEAAAWARMVNQARAPGHCEGLVVEASKRFNSGLSPVTVKLENQGEVTHQIFRAFATQFLAEAQKETLSWQKNLCDKLLMLWVPRFRQVQ